MSAYYSVIFPDSIRLLTDGAVYDSDAGVLTDVKRKVWTSPTLPMAMTGRGPENVIEGFCSNIMTLGSALPSFDMVLMLFPPLLKAMREVHEPMNGPVGLEFLIAGWSEVHGFKQYVITTASAYGPNGEQKVEPYKLLEAGPEIGACVPLTAEELAAKDISEKAAQEEGSSYMAMIGFDMFDAMRAKIIADPTKFHNPEGGPWHRAYFIGGQVDLTTITPGGVRTVTLGSWPDDVPGRRIDGRVEEKAA